MTTPIDWNNKRKLQAAIIKSSTRREVLERLNCSPKSGTNRKKLATAIEKFDLDISTLNTANGRWENLPNVIKDCYCISDVLKAVGLIDKGNNFKTAKRRISEMGLDTSHFRKLHGNAISPYTNEDIFCENSQVHRSTAKNRLLSQKLKPYVCAICNIDEWQGEKLALELDHINGVSNDNRMENLRFLCPNCHSLTPTHRGKNNKIRV